MHALRHPVLQRAVAFLLFAGAGVACVPTVSASSSVDTVLEGELRAALGDSEAVELAIQAARRAPTPEAAIDAFVRAYTADTGETDAAQAIARLLQDHPNRFGAPARPPHQAVWTAASSTAPILPRLASSILTQDPLSVRLERGVVERPGEPPVRQDFRSHRSEQPRGP